MKNLFLGLLLFATPIFAQAPSAPVITSVANAATNTVTVTITEADPAYEIHYSTDGTVPTAASPLYIAPLVLTKSATVKAIAIVIPATTVSSADFTIMVPISVFPFTLSANPASLSFTWQLGATSSMAQSLSVQDSSPCPPAPGVPKCNWPVTATTDVPWLTATPGTTGYVSNVFLVTPKLIAAGTFTGNVILTQPQFKTPTIRVPVTVTVTAAPVIAHSANLTWNASTDAAGYNVLRGAATGGPYTLLGNTSLLAYIDTAVQSGVSFYYVVRAVDSTGTESANSLEVKAVIP